jgi:hypothetical protein
MLRCVFFVSALLISSALASAGHRILVTRPVVAPVVWQPAYVVPPAPMMLPMAGSPMSVAGFDSGYAPLVPAAIPVTVARIRPVAVRPVVVRTRVRPVVVRPAVVRPVVAPMPMWVLPAY